jgi:hypothetical protein
MIPAGHRAPVVEREHRGLAPGPRRVFIGLAEISGHYGNLGRGLRALGIPATVVDLSDHAYEYGLTTRAPIIRLAMRTASLRRRTVDRGMLTREVARALHGVSVLALMLWAIWRHDTFIFGFRGSFLRLWDLPLLRLLRKRVVFVFNGSDARPSFIDGTDLAGGRQALPERMAREKLVAIRRIERWSAARVCDPLYAHYFRLPVIRFHALGIAGPPHGDLPSVPPEPTDGPIRVLHSPSNMRVKGTQRIREAVEQVRREGLDIELVELRNVPNRRVLAAIRECHFVVDQAYSDVWVPGFVAEAALHGRPAVVAGYGWDELRRHSLGDISIPAEHCHPAELVEAIRRLAADGRHRRALGTAARRYIEAWAGDRVAERYLQVVNGRYPQSWRFDPSDLRYVLGQGLSDTEATASVRAVVARDGATALGLDHHAELREEFMKLVAGSGHLHPG